MKHRSRFIKLVVPIAVVAVPVVLYLHKRLKYNQHASCANCRTFMGFHLEEYADKHGGWYPRGGKNPLDSLAKCIPDFREVHLFTSHVLSRKAQDYWKATRSLSEEVCCYRYNEGLRDDDPYGLVVMYYYKPTRWLSWERKMDYLGRPVMRLPILAFGWRFLPEDDFQREQAKTVEYLRERKARWRDMEKMESQLRLLALSIPSDSDARRFGFRLENRGTEPIRLRLLDRGSVGDDGGARLQDVGLAIKGEEVVVDPGEKKDLLGWVEMSLRDIVDDRHGPGFEVRLEGSSGHTAGWRLFSPKPDVEETKGSRWFQARARASVTAGDVKDIEAIVVSDLVKPWAGRDQE